MARSIRDRLQFWSAMVLFAVIVGFGGLVYVRTKMGRMREIDARLIGAAQTIDGMLRTMPREPRPGDGPNRPPPPPPGLRERLFNDLGVPANPPGIDPMYFVIWRQDGVIFKSSKSPNQAADLPLDELPAGMAASARFRANSREVIVLGPRTMTILVGQPLGHFDAEMSQLFWQLAGSGLLVLLFGVAGAGIVAARIVRPITEISKTAAAISASNLSARIDTSRLDSELVTMCTVLNETFGRLEQEFERQTRFTADASHELRTPLAIIHANVELALSRPRSPAEYQSTLHECLAATQRMRSLLDGLLLLARADAGQLNIREQPIDLGGLASQAVARHAEGAEQAGVNLECEQPAEPIYTSGDEPMLSRVIDNLLANALRHTPKNGKIALSIRKDGDEAVLTLSDTGCGISAEAAKHVFERFYRVDNARARTDGGSGLGLAICKSIVEIHGGTIACRSVEGRGSEFEIRLPYRVSELAEVAGV